MAEILAYLVELAPELAIIICGIVNVVISIITYKRSGVISLPSVLIDDKRTEEVVNEDINALIAYHETTANNLRETLKKNKKVGN